MLDKVEGSKELIRLRLASQDRELGGWVSFFLDTALVFLIQVSAKSLLSLSRP